MSFHQLFERIYPLTITVKIQTVQEVCTQLLLELSLCSFNRCLLLDLEERGVEMQPFVSLQEFSPLTAVMVKKCIVLNRELKNKQDAAITHYRSCHMQQGCPYA